MGHTLVREWLVWRGFYGEAYTFLISEWLLTEYCYQYIQIHLVWVVYSFWPNFCPMHNCGWKQIKQISVICCKMCTLIKVCFFHTKCWSYHYHLHMLWTVPSSLNVNFYWTLYDLFAMLVISLTFLWFWFCPHWLGTFKSKLTILLLIKLKCEHSGNEVSLWCFFDIHSTSLYVIYCTSHMCLI